MITPDLLDSSEGRMWDKQCKPEDDGSVQVRLGVIMAAFASARARRHNVAEVELPVGATILSFPA